MESPDNSPIYKIAAEISNADAKLLSEISECLIHTSNYFHKHLENYENRGMEEERDIDKIRWRYPASPAYSHNVLNESRRQANMT